MSDSQDIPPISELCLRYSRTSPHPRKYPSDIQEIPSSMKRAGGTHVPPLIQENMSKIFKNFPAKNGMRRFFTAFTKIAICPFPKADETGPPVSISFLIYILTSFFSVTYVLQVAAFLHALSSKHFREYF